MLEFSETFVEYFNTILATNYIAKSPFACVAITSIK